MTTYSAHVRFCAMAAVVLALTPVLHAQAVAPLPLKYSGPPTKAEITAGDLMTRLYIFSDDSMMGRKIGEPGNLKGTDYIEREVRRLGLKPAGDSGGYFQYVPVAFRAYDTTSTITIDGVTYAGNADFFAADDGHPVQLNGMPVVFGGMQYDTLNIFPNGALRDKVVIVTPFTPAPGFTQGPFIASHGFQAYQESMHGATVLTVLPAGALIATGAINPLVIRSRLAPRLSLTTDPTPVALYVTARVFEAIMGGPLNAATKGAAGKPITSDVHFTDGPAVARNVVAILPGSDAKLKYEYVAIGGHNDHIGVAPRAVDHDSLRVFNEIVRPEGADSPTRAATPDEMTRIRALADSLHALHAARRDSIFNGADDDGTGSVSVLEIAEAFAKGSAKPKRSIIFVWHVGEEAGLWGSAYFTDHPTVPRDSIVAQLNMDMVGRGAATDITGQTKDGKDIHGGPGYLQLVGSRRLSTELGDLVERVNTEKKLGLNFDYSMDADGHPQDIYCRSDHANYARYGIPIVFFTTGGHADYHQVTDEAEYIDYDRMAQVDKLVFETALRVANLDHRPLVDKPKPDPHGDCRQ